MTLAAPSAVAFAVVAGSPADARRWITVDLAGYPGSGRRGYIVAAEPVGSSWNALALCSRIQDVIITELRRRQHLPVDEAIGRAFAVANGVVYGEGRDAAFAGPERAPLIGVTAIVFDDETVTIGHLPPGQLVLIQDGLIYTVPELESWFPDYKPAAIPGGQAEPLGYASWTAPLIAQSELRAGDTIIMCSSVTGRALADELAGSGQTTRHLSYLHHRDPDAVLDTLKEIVIGRKLTAASAAVIGFPPLPASQQIQTLGDVRTRAVDQWRHARAVLSQWKPARQPRLAAQPFTSEAIAAGPATPAVAPQAVNTAQGTQVVRKLTRVFEPEPKARNLWRKPPEHAQLGIPAKHGVDVFRGQTHYMGDQSWRHNLPRLPIIGSSWIWMLLVLVIAGIVLGGMYLRQERAMPGLDVDTAVARIDRALVAARDEDDADEAIQELLAVQDLIEQARRGGAPDSMLDQRQQVVTELLDDLTDVVRTSDVQRIGTLPEEFSAVDVQGVYTPAGVFFVAGGLYQYRPSETGETPELVTILEQGDTVGDVNVGALWGVAFDFHGLYATDGNTVFMLPVESQQWRAIAMGRINDQPWEPGPVAAFDGSLYLLQANYRQIYRFPVARTEDVSEPRDWLLTGARDQVNMAIDIAIDGRIYLLLEDGSVQVMLRGDLEAELNPPYVAPERARALIGPGGAGYLYVAVENLETGDGRIVAFDVEGEHTVQLRLPVGFTTGDAEVRMPFDGLQDVIVDESTGTIFIINGDAIWTTRYSLAPVADDEEPLPEEDEATPVSL